MSERIVARSWYREPWPWILASGPAIVVVAGLYTMYLAVSSADGLVADDYYKQGLGINRVIAREERAGALGMSAVARFEAAGRVRITLSNAVLEPPSLRVQLVHRTRAHQDRGAIAARTGPGTYEAALDAPREGAWMVHVEDPSGDWRVSGRWRAGEPSVEMHGGTP